MMLAKNGNGEPPLGDSPLPISLRFGDLREHRNRGKPLQ